MTVACTHLLETFAVLVLNQAGQQQLCGALHLFDDEATNVSEAVVQRFVLSLLSLNPH